VNALAAGARVHLERPLRLGDALGGHLVAGHVDGVGEIVARAERAGALDLEIAAPPEVAPTLVPKGSITVDGVSLTVNAVDGARFKVTLIPHTLAVTGLGDKALGDAVNLEADLIGKTIERLVANRLGAEAAARAEAAAPPAAGGLTLATLRKHGFAG
jgi:riboflavin synthase